MRRYGVFIPERFAFKGLTGQFLPQLWNQKDGYAFCVPAERLKATEFIQN